MEQQKNEKSADEPIESVPSVSKTRRDFLKAATVAAGALAVGAGASNETRAAGGGAPAKAAAAAAAAKSAGGIPVPDANTKTFVAGKYPKGTMMASPRAIGANDRIVVASVGIGGQGGYHLRNFVDDAEERNIALGGVCDVYQPFLDGATKKAKEKFADVMSTDDYRKLLERKDIDAVVIATPEHWHGQVACHAMDAGKHVYIEKPMTRYVDEAFQVYDAAKRNKSVVQVGSQGCTDVRWHAAAKAIREGKLGKLVMGQGSYTRNNRNGEWNYGIPAEISQQSFEWDRWLGSAPDRPFRFEGPADDGKQIMRDDTGARFRRYRKYWDYSAGILGDLMPHKLHPFLIASGNPEFPTRVLSIGTNSVQDKDREVADTVQVMAEFPSGWSMLFVGSTVNEQGLQDIFRGEKSTIYFGNGVEVRPERPWSEEVEGYTVDTNAPDLARYARYEEVPAHEKNWLEAIRKNDPMWCNCNIDLGTKVQTIVSLAEMSQRMNRAMLFDEKTRKWSAA